MERDKKYPILRKCDYDPNQDMILVTYGNEADANATRQLYLEVKYRVFWFNRWCEENGKVGVIDCSEHQEEPMMPGVSVKAKVFVDGQLFASAVAGECYMPGNYEHNTKAIQTAATRAVGRALANAGFGTISAGVPSEEGDALPVDSGITVERNPDNPLLFVRRKPVEAPAVEQKPEPAADATVEAPPVVEQEAEPDLPAPAPVPEEKEPAAEQSEAPASDVSDVLAKARALVMPIGKNKGKTLGEIAESNFRAVQWFASDEFDASGRHPDIKAAAKLIVEALGGSNT